MENENYRFKSLQINKIFKRSDFNDQYFDMYDEVYKVIENFYKESNIWVLNVLVFLRIDGHDCTELLMREDSDSNIMYWDNDWYEGEEVVELRGFIDICDLKYDDIKQYKD